MCLNKSPAIMQKLFISNDKKKDKPLKLNDNYYISIVL